MSWDEELKARRAQEKIDSDNYAVICQTVALLLGGDLEPPNPDKEHGYNWHYNITFPDGSGICIAAKVWANKGKLSVSGEYPRDRSGRRFCDKYPESINVSETKTPEQIAKDIQRRFMPEYKVAYAGAIEAKQRNDDYHSKVNATKDLLCSIQGVTRSTHDEQRLYISTGNIGGTITYISSDGTCSLELRNVKAELLKHLLTTM